MRKLLLSLMLIAAPVSAQQPAVSALYEVGATLYNSKDEAVDVADLRGWVAVAGIALPLPGETVTGLMAEAGYTTRTVWSVWSMTETEIERVIAGAHMRIANGQPSEGSEFDFDFRVVGGYRFTKNLGLRVYFLQDDTPVGFSLGWKF
jgi:hypothetical protein